MTLMTSSCCALAAPKVITSRMMNNAKIDKHFFFSSYKLVLLQYLECYQFTKELMVIPIELFCTSQQSHKTQPIYNPKNGKLFNFSNWHSWCGIVGVTFWLIFFEKYRLNYFDLLAFGANLVFERCETRRMSIIFTYHTELYPINV